MKYYKTTLAFFLGYWVLIYAWLCYVNWEILNPIQGLIDLPTLVWQDRVASASILILWVFISAISTVGYYQKEITNEQ
jgi:hypothetical protein